MDPFEPSPVGRVRLELYTSTFRVAGLISTRFRRVVDMLNLAGVTNLTLAEATIEEYAAGEPRATGAEVHVSAAEVLLALAEEEAPPSSDLQVQKRAAPAAIGLPPFWVVGKLHAMSGTNVADTFFNPTDRFLAVTEAQIRSAARPALDRDVPVVAVNRRRAELFASGEPTDHPEELLADVLDERTAASWLHAAPREPDR